MIAFIHLVDRTVAEYQSVAELATTLKEVETELLNNSKKLKLLEENDEDLSLKVDSLTKNIKEKEEEISELKKENLNLKYLLQKLKDKFYFIKHFIITKLIDHKEKDKNNNAVMSGIVPGSIIAFLIFGFIVINIEQYYEEKNDIANRYSLGFNLLNFIVLIGSSLLCENQTIIITITLLSILIYTIYVAIKSLRSEKLYISSTTADSTQ